MQRQKQLSDYIAVSSYEVVKRLKLPIYYYYLLMIFDLALVLYVLSHELPYSSDPEIKDKIDQFYLREIFHNQVTHFQKQMLIYLVGSFYLIIALVFISISFLIVKNDYLLRKGHVIIESLFKGAGQIFMIVNYITFVPSMIIFAEVERCYRDGGDSMDPKYQDYHFVCLEEPHFSLMIFAIASALIAIGIVVFTNFFINSQFPSEEIPYACWDSKSRAIYSLWKVVYICHYDIIEEKYRMTIRIGAFFILIYLLLIKMEQPRVYIKSIHWFDLFALAVIFTIHLFIIMQDLITENVYFELLPLILITALVFGVILISRQSHKHKDIISRDSRQTNLFKNENDMQLYVSLLMCELVKLKSLDKGVEHSSSPQIFTIISRHMEHCRNEECICKKYEPEYDKKFSSIGSRRLTMRQSTSFSSIDYMFKKKIPIKISYETKCGIFMAEISDCIDRFLKEHKSSVGLKLQKSFFNHAYVNSSYKALFVQLENAHQCSAFRGKINIYHLKTKIQEEMTQSEASPFSMDITTCLKFEAKRVEFEKRIIDLCVVCESFWNELSQSESDYSVENIHKLLLEIAKVIITIKTIFSQLCQYNPQNVDVIQNYALIYRYILRDEFRFNDIVNNLNQLKKTNKLEQTRELVPKFFDSDNYAMILVSGDVKDLGRMIKANRGVEYIFGYMPNELQGSKINKIMPQLFAQVHDEFIQNFLRRGHSNFIDRNQFLLVENKLRFIQMTLAYVKAMVDLKMGLMFVTFFKLPLKVPSNQEGSNFIKAKDAHYVLCDSKGQIHGISHNCMKNLGIPPTIISRSKGQVDMSSLVSIDLFSHNILGPEYEFDLPKGMNFHFDTTSFKSDKYLAKEFNELTGRMRKYNIFVSLRKFEYRLAQNNLHEVLLFTIEIISFQLSEAPITIPVDKEEDQSFTQYSGTTVSSVNSDELRTSKFKEFKAQVQELKIPTKVSVLKKITVAFFVFLLAVFSLNYALCATQNQAYIERVDVLDILYRLTDKIPSTSRYVRTALNIANGYEANSNEVIPNRFSYYMQRISENSEQFRVLQEQIYTQYRQSLSLDDVKLRVKDLQTDLTIKQIDSSISSSLNMFSSKALQISRMNLSQLANVSVPYISFDFNLSTVKMPNFTLTKVQQDLYFVLQNGHEALPQALLQLNEMSQNKIQKSSDTFKLVSLIIAIISIIVNFVIVPIVYPLFVHYERLAYFILHSLNKLTKKFIENEVKSCNQLFSYIGKKQGSGANDKKSGTMMKKPEARKENKQLMKVNPKIPKHLIEQEKRKIQQKRDRRLRRGRSGTARQSQYHQEDENGVDTQYMNEEEEKELMVKVERLDKGFEPDEDSDYLDEDLDEDQESRVSRKSHRKHGANLVSRYHYAGGGAQSRGAKSKGQGQAMNYATGSMTSIDESTIRTSMQMNSSTNKSSVGESSGEDEEESYSSSTDSNYSHYTNVSQWKVLKQSQYGDQQQSNATMTYDITQAKSSELAGDHYVDKQDAEMTDEERELKRLIRDRQHKIKRNLKSRKCKKILYLILFVIVIQIYLGVNTMYTRFVFQYEDQLQTNINTIDQRMLCYPFSLTILKEMVARNQSIVTQFYKDVDTTQISQIDRTQIIYCYALEKEFNEMVLGQTESTKGLTDLASEYQVIQDSLGKNNLCDTLYMKQMNQGNPAKYKLCEDAYDGINNLGLYEMLNFILRDEEKIIIAFDYQSSNRQELISLLRNSTLTQLETMKDIFIDDAMKLQRTQMISKIALLAKQLFRIFDILFSVFVTVCFIMVTIGVFYLIKKLQQLIIQIYHIVLLIPYGERTKREINELLKINL